MLGSDQAESKGEDEVTLPLADKLKTGIMTLHRRTEPATGPWEPKIDELRELVELVDGLGYDSLWTGDHIAFAIPILDPLLQIAQASAFSRRLTFGTCVYLLALRHPTPVAKQIATLDHLTEGRFVFGVGVGGEFPGEFAASGIPHKERGARVNEGIEVVRKLWTGEKVAHQGRFFEFPETLMLPPPRQAGGPPIWVGGRTDAAFKRAARLCDGYVSYVITPDMFADALSKIETFAGEAGRSFDRFDTAHLLFARIDDSYERAFEAASRSLSTRYAMDFSKATKRYAAIGKPEDVAERVRAYYDAGVRHVIMDLVGPYEERDRQIERFAKEVKPLLADIL